MIWIGHIRRQCNDSSSSGVDPNLLERTHWRVSSRVVVLSRAVAHRT